MSPDKKAGRFAELALASVCLLWGSTFVLVKNALPDISPALFLAFRFSIATALLSFIFLARRKPERLPALGPQSEFRRAALFRGHRGSGSGHPDGAARRGAPLARGAASGGGLGRFSAVSYQR